VSATETQAPTIRLPKDIYEQLRREAFDKRTSQTAIITEALSQRYGNDTVPVKIIDLLTVIARLEQADREGKIEHDASAAERLVTCDLPRLKAYLPDEACRELDAP
jgi:hypothetical protein